jgi:hypothetical protein
MMSTPLRPTVASTLVVALTLATAPVFAAPTPAPATLTGTVYAGDVKTPLAGATVVVTDAAGVKSASHPTGADGTFAITSLAPGAGALTLETKDGSFAVATPVTLAPGATLGVRVALKAEGDPPADKKKKKGGGAGWTGGAIGAMTAVLVGFAAAAVVADDNKSNNDQPPVSPSTPN